MERARPFTPRNIAIRMEVDRRRELLASIDFVDNIFMNQEEEPEEIEEKFNPFLHRDFIIIILEFCTPDSLSKLNRINKDIRSIISENQKYLTTIAEFKYRVVSYKYEKLMQAYKVREDVLLSLHSGISKAINEEEENQNSLRDAVNELYLKGQFIGQKRTPISASIFLPNSQKYGKFGNTLTTPSPQMPSKVLEEEKITAVPKEPELDDIFERQKLANLERLREHQEKIEKELPLYYERKAKKHNFIRPKPKIDLDETKFERHYRLMKEKQQDETNK